MHCWNCGKRVSKTAKVCQYCEASMEDAPTEEEKGLVAEFLTQLPMEELQAVFEQSATAEDFANRILVGDCPKCGSMETGNCEDDPEIDNILVGRCYKCGQLWCTECGHLLEHASPSCNCWDE
jgi:hypothetical protein